MTAQRYKLVISLMIAAFLGYIVWQHHPRVMTPDILMPELRYQAPELLQPDMRYLLNISLEDMSCMALNIYHEARGETHSGMLAVGYVTQNRARDARFPDQICDVVFQGKHGVNHHGQTVPYLYRCQFSWYCDGRSDQVSDLRAWQTSLAAAIHVLENPDQDITGGALYYFNQRHVSVDNLAWFQGMTETARIGNHSFRVPRG